METSADKSLGSSISQNLLRYQQRGLGRFSAPRVCGSIVQANGLSKQGSLNRSTQRSGCVAGSKSTNTHSKAFSNQGGKGPRRSLGLLHRMGQGFVSRMQRPIFQSQEMAPQVVLIGKQLLDPAKVQETHAKKRVVYLWVRRPRLQNPMIPWGRQ